MKEDTILLDDLFLTLEGQNLLHYFEQTYPNNYQILSLNEMLEAVLFPFLNEYFENVNAISLKASLTEKKTFKEISYNEMISKIKERFKNDFTENTTQKNNSIFNLDAHKKIDFTQLN